jgi:hypothetical protein
MVGNIPQLSLACWCYHLERVKSSWYAQTKKEFSQLQHDGLTVNECLNKFTQMSRYAPDDVNTDEKK